MITGSRNWWIGLAASICACAAPHQTTIAASAASKSDGADAGDLASQPVMGQDAQPADAKPNGSLDLGPDATTDALDGTQADAAAEESSTSDSAAPPAASSWQACRAAVAEGPWWRASVGYEIFVRSFADSDGDGLGDLKGILQHFDHLNDGKPGGDDLGVDLLWLMPIHPSPSYHGYDVTDYQGVRAQYGSPADFEALTQLAHSRGVKVVIDLVVNHSSSQHPWFLDAKSKGPKEDWYVWRNTPAEPAWKQPWSGGGKVWHVSDKRWYYGVFSQGMPDLNLQNPLVGQAITAAADVWLQRGADGFRLDAVRYLVETGAGPGQQDSPATLAWWKEFSSHVAQKAPQSLLVAEAWASGAVTAKYHSQGGLAMTFDFDLQSSLVSALQGGIGDGVRTVTCQHDTLLGAAAAAAGRGTFLSNHDQLRWTQAIADPALRKVAAALLFFVPGTPFLYYGDEIAAENGPTKDDIDKRLPMAWDASPKGGFTTGTPWAAMTEHATANVATQLANPQSQLRWVQKLAGLRRAHPVLQRGKLGWLDAPDGWLIGVRELAGQTLVGVFRLDDQGSAVVPSLDALGPLAKATNWLTGSDFEIVNGRAQLSPMAGPSAVWLAVQ